MYGGDDINAVVWDMGSLFTRGGFAGEDIPKASFHTAVGVERSDVRRHDSTAHTAAVSSAVILNDDADAIAEANTTMHNTTTPLPTPYHPCETSSRKYYTGRSQLSPRPHMDVISPLSEGSQVSDWGAVEQLLDYTFHHHLATNLAEHPFFYCEPSQTSSQQRERWCELLFERFHTPAFFSGRQPVLASFAAGRATSLVLEMGADLTTVTPVNEGYVLQRGIKRTKIAGNLLDEVTERLLPELQQHQLLPTYAQQPAQQSQHLTESYLRFMRHETLRDLKESICKVTEQPFDLTSTIKLPSQPYTLPDGKTIEVGNERFLIGELLFRPDCLPSALPASSKHSPTLDPHFTFNGLHKMITASIDSTDADLRRTLYENIVLAGGSTLIPGLPARLQRELTNNIGPLYRVKFLTGNTIADRRYADWLGGSILASLGSFHQMWISKQEFEEHGARIIHKKCP